MGRIPINCRTRSLGIRPHAERAALPRGFTLVELLVVIAVIAVLLSILLPVMGKARKAAMMTICLSNQRQIYVGEMSYASDNRGALTCPAVSSYEPWHAYLASTAGLVKNSPRHIGLLWVGRQLRTVKIFYCPLSSAEGMRPEDYTDPQTSEWRSYRGFPFGGDYTRSSYLVNPLGYLRLGSSQRVISLPPAIDFRGGASDLPFIYDWPFLFSGAHMTSHAPQYNVMMLDGSARQYQSAQFENLYKIYDLGHNWQQHATALKALVGG